MSKENGLPEINTSLVYLDVRNTQFGGFSPETEAGQQLFKMLGSSGVIGAELADRLRASAENSGDDAVIAAMEENLNDPA